MATPIGMQLVAVLVMGIPDYPNHHLLSFRFPKTEILHTWVAQFRLVSLCLKWNCQVVQWSVFSY